MSWATGSYRRRAGGGLSGAQLPADIRDAVADALRRAAGSSELREVSGVGGGCISPALRLRVASGERYFLKWRRPDEPGAGMFAAEANSLRALAETGALRVPRVLALEDGRADAASWLLLEWLEPGTTSPAGWEELGRNLAALHRTVAPQPGWREDNFIGPLPQPNRPAADWPSFWVERRLRPQLERAGGAFDARDSARFERLFEALPEVLAVGGREGASLLHGDLWGGNVQQLEDGGAAVIDPSTYYGHREVDLAMAELFGGFPRAFHEAYREAWPLADGFPRRRAVYQLYYLLVHVNCFGGGYVQSTRSALASAGF